jgi:hypothetical protein
MLIELNKYVGLVPGYFFKQFFENNLTELGIDLQFSFISSVFLDLAVGLVYMTISFAFIFLGLLQTLYYHKKESNSY